MAIHLNVSRLDRLVMVVIIGDATASDMLALAHQFADADMMPYRKIVDITAGTLVVDDAELASAVAVLRADPGMTVRGPLAFVVDAVGSPVAEKFVELTTGERPVKIFRSLHAARKWLDECSAIQPRR
jgi:hypothetical protein